MSPVVKPGTIELPETEDPPASGIPVDPLAQNLTPEQYAALLYQSPRSAGLQIGGASVGVFEVIDYFVKWCQDLSAQSAYHFPDSTWPMLECLLIFAATGGLATLLHRWWKDS